MLSPITLLLLTSWTLVGVEAVIGQSSSHRDLQCEPIKIEQCTHDYNSTGMPNLMGHQLQGDAKAILETFMPLIQYECSSELQFFLCSVHVPMCVTLPGEGSDPAHTLIGPCRPLCQRVKAACERVLKNFNLEWPEALECDRFPPSNDLENMCMEGGINTSRANQNRKFNEGAKAFQTLFNYPGLLSDPKFKEKLSKEKPELANFNEIYRIIENSHNIKPAKGFSDKSHHDKCSSVKFPVNYHYINRTDECVPQCNKDIIYHKEDKKFAEIWIGVWASLCFLSTSLTLITFMLDTTVFLYPEKCIIFLNLCYFIMSFGYLLRLFLGAEAVSCMSMLSEPNKSVNLLVKEGLTATPACTIVFILIYFSIISSAIWWTIITTTWAVMVFCSLPQSSLTPKAPLFHSFGWGIPAALTVSCLVLHHIEGDELTGICLPGQQTESTLLHMLIIPCSIALGSGFIFFLSGLIASLILPSENTRRLMARISVFFILYSLPQTCVVGSLVYEMIERPQWRTDVTRPNIEVFILRIFMMLIVGIITCAWCCTNKSLKSWKNLFSKCCGFWGGSKKPPTPVFPKVAYHQTSGDTSSDVVTLGEIATLKRGGYIQEGLPLVPHDRRVVIGCQDNNRIVL